jgi:hypothetical protein
MKRREASCGQAMSVGLSRPFEFWTVCRIFMKFCTGHRERNVAYWLCNCRSYKLLTYLLTYLLHGATKSWLSLSLSKNIPLSLWNPKFHYRVHTSPPPDPILSQLNPVRLIDPYLPKVHLNVILPPTPRSSQWSLTFRPPNQNPVNTSPPMRAT